MGSVSSTGVPHIRAMLVEEQDEFNTFWFTTAYDTSKIEHYKNNPCASVYFADTKNYQGILLTGIMEMDSFPLLKKKFWKDYYLTYYPNGISDVQYTVLKFKVEKIIFYDGKNTRELI